MSRMKVYHSVLWLNESQVLSGYPSGDILCWNIRQNGKWNIIKNAHSRTIFKICRDCLTGQFVSVSMDRQLVIWNSESLIPVHIIPSLAGFVYSISITPLDPHKIVFGVGDNTVRVWSTGNGNNRYQSANFWQGIKTKVLVVASHPCKEGIFGFGTEDGHIGCGSWLSYKSDISASHHKKSVYSLSWGPCCSLEENNSEDKSLKGDALKINSLYSVGGEGCILMHKMGAFNQEATDITKMIKQVNNIEIVPLRSEISWKADYNHVAIGNEDGSIDIFVSVKLMHICRINVHKKMVNCLAWHHDYSATPSEQDYSYWLASGSNEDIVCVYYLKAVITAVEPPEDAQPVSLTNSLNHFNGHNGRITRVAWSPHSNGLLASSSYDGSVQIWDVVKNEPVCNFRGHIGRVQTVFWSFIDEDIVLSGGEDFTLRRWKVSEQSHRLPPAAKKVKSKSKRNKSKGEQQINSQIESTEHYNNKHEKNSAIQSTAEVMQKAEAEIDDSGPIDEITVNVISDQKDADRKKKKIKSLLKKSSVADSKKKEARQEDCIKLAEYLKAESDEKGSGRAAIGIVPGENDHVNFGFYGTRQDAFKMLQSECVGHHDNGSFDQLLQLQVWRNNVGELLNKSAEEKTLNDTLVALSPLGGYDMWKAATLAYAEQLESKRNFHMAVVYYMALGDVYKAIDVFKSNGMYKEALVLAKIQLSSKDPWLNELYLLWAKKLSTESNYENAAHCYLAAGFVDDAIEMLAKRADSSSLLTAIKVAGIYGLEKRTSEYVVKCAELLLKEAKWKICQEVMKKFQSIKVHHLQAVVSEYLVETLLQSDLIASSEASENHKMHMFYTDKNFSLPDYLEDVKFDKFQCTFVSKVLSAWKCIYDISPETINEISCCSKDSMKSMLNLGSTQNYSACEILYQISSFVLAGFVSLLRQDCYGGFQLWLRAFDVLMCSGYHSSLDALFYCLFPRPVSVSFNLLIDSFNTGVENKNAKDCFTNFMAYKYVGMLCAQWWRVPQKNTSVGCVDNIEDIVQQSSATQSNGNRIVDMRKTDCSSEKNAENDVLVHIKETAYFLCTSRKDFMNENSCFDLSESVLCGSLDLLSLTSISGSVLLSEIHTEYFTVQNEFKKKTDRLLELDIKKRLAGHLNQKKNDRKQRNDIPNEVQECLNDVISEVVALPSNNSEKDLLQQNLASMSEEERLKATKKDLLHQLELFPAHIKDLPFPNPEYTCIILLYVCCTESTENEQLVELLRRIHKWSVNNGVYKKQSAYLEKLLEKFLC
ncbi:gem-associated protein 5-like isoform X2 [Hydractinia symbiolongicarpus]|nr:gem-associated protein 5-like isoform X2 [Hydractinia symbiolongicarpus]